tara:strand:- start:3334 stop:4284 length:951 start_codon:yes stop_codon:yes gene_type:complete
MSNGEKLENNFEFISYINQIVQVNNFVIPAEIIGIDAKLKYISDNYGLDLKADFDAIKDEQEERILKDPVGLPNEIVVNGEVVNTYDYLVREFPGFVPYVTGDAKSILDSFKTDAQIQAIQQQLQDAGYLKQGAYFPGVLDEVTYQKFNELLKDSNNNGSKWRSFLNKVLTNPKLDLSEIPDKPQLDYNDITNTVISSVKKEIGREPTKEELDILTGILSAYKTEEFEQGKTALIAQAGPQYEMEKIMFEGRNVPTGGVRKLEEPEVNIQNAESRFTNKVKELFKPEMDLNQRREQTQNVANIIKSSVAGLRSIGG